ncbi:helix-turn-helix transcriptional regulator [Spirochaetia bacterium]|nr:helix-turn-helix transcriptional regulator [Spirochaetia bacterium]
MLQIQEYCGKPMPDREFNPDVSLERPRINALLKKALESPVVTVIAPEGYGKTHSVNSFLKTCNVTTVWIQLSERDNLVSRSWENFAGAISFHNKKTGTLLEEIGFPETNRQFDRYRALISKTIILQKKYVIVLDDFHKINNQSILRLLSRITAVPFSNTTIMLISRNDPEINTVSLLSKGILTRISIEDLRFSEQEIGDYFQMQDLPMTAEELAQICRDTEGWPLALNTIAADSKAGKPGEALYSPGQMKTRFFKMIEDNYFFGIEKELRKFLIKLSLIEQWPHELLEELAQDKKTAGGMERINPLIHYDAYVHGYRIHRLFLEFLREKQSELSAEEIREVYIQTAQWCAANKLRMDAAINYKNAKDYRGLIALIYSFPRILPNETAAFFLEIVERLILDKKDGDGPFLFLRYAIRPKLLLSMGRYEEASAVSRGAITKFEGLAQSSVNSRILCANYIVLGTIAVFTCRFTRNYNIAPWFEKADFYYSRHPFPLEGPVTQGSITSYVCQVAYPAEKGAFEKAIQGFAPVIPYAAHTLNGFLYDVDALAHCEFAYFKGDLPEAENFARRAVFRAREKNQYEIENRGLFFLLRISLHTGNLSEIQELFRQLDAQLEAGDYLNRYIFYDVTTGWFYAQTGNTGKAALWLKNDFEKSELNDLFHCFEIMVKAKCSFAEKRYDAVLKTLENQGDKNWLESFLLGKLEKTALRAAALYHLGEKDAALHELAAAYEMAFPNSLDMPFIEMGEDMRRLAGAALNSKNCAIPPTWLETIRNRASAYGKKLFLIAEAFRRTAPDEKGQAPPVILFRREKAVLRSLSLGLTREKIAAEENVSLNAVKEIIKNLYTKLGALNRADAIRIATALGFLKNSSH